MVLSVSAAAELTGKPIFIGGDGFSPSMHEIAGRHHGGKLLGLQHGPDQPPAGSSALQVFEKEYGKPAAEPSNVANAYDLITWVAEAIKKAGKADPVAVRDAMENTKDLRLVHFTLTVDKEITTP